MRLIATLVFTFSLSSAIFLVLSSLAIIADIFNGALSIFIVFLSMVLGAGFSYLAFDHKKKPISKN